MAGIWLSIRVDLVEGHGEHQLCRRVSQLSYPTVCILPGMCRHDDDDSGRHAERASRNRFAKNTLGWTAPALRTPEQADRWTWLVVAAYTQLRLARGLVADDRLPWERPCDPAKLTPVRVRRGFRRLRAMLGTPASPPKSTTAGPGRPRGTRRPPRTRYPALKKAA